MALDSKAIIEIMQKIGKDIKQQVIDLWGSTPYSVRMRVIEFCNAWAVEGSLPVSLPPGCNTPLIQWKVRGMVPVPISPLSSLDFGNTGPVLATICYTAGEIGFYPGAEPLMVRRYTPAGWCEQKREWVVDLPQILCRENSGDEVCDLFGVIDVAMGTFPERIESFVGACMEKKKEEDATFLFRKVLGWMRNHRVLMQQDDRRAALGRCVMDELKDVTVGLKSLDGFAGNESLQSLCKRCDKLLVALMNMGFNPYDEDDR